MRFAGRGARLYTHAEFTGGQHACSAMRCHSEKKKSNNTILHYYYWRVLDDDLRRGYTGMACGFCSPEQSIIVARQHTDLRYSHHCIINLQRTLGASFSPLNRWHPAVCAWIARLLLCSGCYYMMVSFSTVHIYGLDWAIHHVNASSLA